MKNPVTLSEIDPATFRFVEQCLNYCATACPEYLKIAGNTSLKVMMSKVVMIPTQ
jgi:hypothetical protein